MMNMKSSRTNSRMIKFEFLCVENVNKICLHSGKNIGRQLSHEKLFDLHHFPKFKRS